MKGCRLAWLALLVASGPVLADGGVPVESRIVDGARWTLLMQPGRALVGPARFTLLSPHAATVQLEVEGEAFRSGCVLREETGRPGLHGTVELERSGPCRVRVMADGRDAPLMDVRIEVAPPDPAWFARLPWALSWMPLLAVVAASRWRSSRRLH